MKTSRLFLPLMMVAGAIILSYATHVYSHQVRKLTKDDLPAAVRGAFSKAYPRGTIRNVDREMEDGKMLYEVESIDGSTNRNILYTPEGKTWEVEEPVAPELLPGVVIKALKKQSPDGKIVRAEKVMRGKAVEYELQIERKQRITGWVIDAKGNVVTSGAVEKKTEKEGSEEEDGEEDDND